MGNFVSVSIPCDSWMNKVSQWLDEEGGYTHNLEKNLTALETTMEELKARRDDLSRKVKREEDRGLPRLAEVQVWLNRVEIIENRVNDILSTRNVNLQRLCLCGLCSKSLKSSYRYGKRVFLTLKEVEKLEGKVFEAASEQGQTSEFEEMPLPPRIVGQEAMLDKAWKHLMDDGVAIMGMHGMGGVGKTTLLAQINNRFSDTNRGFDFVIWVVVSKELHVEKIQNEIARKVGLDGEDWKQKEESQKRLHLYNFLRKKRFGLLLDDIWEKLDLAKIGVPFPTVENRCKVAFTTRSLDVCTSMGVEDPMEVQCLSEDDALDLFQEKVGKITLGTDPEIPNLARIVSKKCSGLPLALSILGETMSCKRTMQEWRHAIDVLTSYAIEFSGMKDQILPLLKYSYDSLKEEHVKQCLLYCALFQKDEDIPKEKLIEYWICEGIIDGSEGVERAENKGYDIIGSLIRASLLMEAVNYGELEDTVCMHDVVREMALWMASDLGMEKEAFFVRAGVGLKEMPKVENWSVVRRMSLMNNKIHHLIGSPECPQLRTMLLRNAYLTNISSELFMAMPKLTVLDLSDNKKLSELPGVISGLVSLQYLSLSSTGIHSLPMGLQELKKLIHLDLEETLELSSIAGIKKLCSLKVLKLAGSAILWDVDIVEELETLEQLEILTTEFDDLPVQQEQFLSSHRLTSCTRILSISLESSGITLPVNMDKLRKIKIWGSTISEIKLGRICINSKTISPIDNPKNPCFLSLSTVFIIECQCLRELTLLMFVPTLKYLTVMNSNQLEDIINKEKACEGEKSGIIPFSKLISLHLDSLPELKNIYWSPLPLSCLKRLKVVECPNLKKVPFDSQSGKQSEDGLVIYYDEKEWIEGVEWEDEATKTHFLLSGQVKRVFFNPRPSESDLIEFYLSSID